MAPVIRTFFLLSSFTYQIACTQECSEGTFGEDCSSSCSARHCVNQSRCDPVSGFCENGCLAGWSGLTCMQNVPAGVHAPVAPVTVSDIVKVIVASVASLMVLILVLLTVQAIRMNLNPGSSKKASTCVNRTVIERYPASVYITPTPTNRSTRRDHINPRNNDIATRDNISASNTDSPMPTDHIYTGITSGTATEHIYTGITPSKTASAAKPSNYETLQRTEDNPYTTLEGRNVIVNVKGIPR